MSASAGPINLFEFEAIAKERLPKEEYNYIAGGANDDQIFGQLGNDVIHGDGSIDIAVGTLANVGVSVEVAVYVGVSVEVAVYVGVSVEVAVYVGVSVNVSVYVGVSVKVAV